MHKIATAILISTVQAQGKSCSCVCAQCDISCIKTVTQNSWQNNICVWNISYTFVFFCPVKERTQWSLLEEGAQVPSRVWRVKYFLACPITPVMVCADLNYVLSIVECWITCVRWTASTATLHLSGVYLKQAPWDVSNNFTSKLSTTMCFFFKCHSDQNSVSNLMGSIHHETLLNFVLVSN